MKMEVPQFWGTSILYIHIKISLTSQDKAQLEASSMKLKDAAFLVYLCNGLLLLTFATMKKYILIGFLLIVVGFSCKNNDKKDNATSENDVDAARNFIRAALDGKWNEARNYMVEDSVNVQLLENTEQIYNAISKEDKGITGKQRSSGMKQGQ